MPQKPKRTLRRDRERPDTPKTYEQINRRQVAEAEAYRWAHPVQNVKTVRKKKN